jgi:hypothetical protein
MRIEVPARAGWAPGRWARRGAEDFLSLYDQQARVAGLGLESEG